MFRYRLMIMLGISWIFLALNLERPDVVLLIGAINIASFVYVLGAFSVIVMLLFPQLAKVPTAIVFIPFFIVYLLGKIIFSPQDLTRAQETTLTFVEAGGLFIGIWLFQEVAASLGQFSTALETIFVGKEKTQVLDRLEGENVIQRKIDLARRFERGLAILYVKLNHQTASSRRLWDQEANLRHVYMQVQLAELMNYLVDLADVRMWHHGNLVLCLEDTMPEKTERTALQIQLVLHDVLKLDTQIGIAHFPDDGLIYQDLIEISQRDATRKVEAAKADKRSTGSFNNPLTVQEGAGR
ncbi:MAG: hypothetical protein JXA10_19320 [Anaerolineae bacterium]|nr:hypothetical protein [Anaerolineae bacterium]